jgi:hypothetical protein
MVKIVVIVEALSFCKIEIVKDKYSEKGVGASSGGRLGGGGGGVNVK